MCYVFHMEFITDIDSSRQEKANVASKPQTFILRDPVVNRLLSTVDKEWQFWALVTENFSNPSYHRAYLSFVLLRRDSARAVERYRAYRDVLLFIPEERAKIRIIDEMLKKLQSVILLELAAKPTRGSFLNGHYPGAQRILWFLLGVLVFFKLLAH